MKGISTCCTCVIFGTAPQVSTCRWVTVTTVTRHHQASCAIRPTQQLIPLRDIGETHLSYERSINKKQLVSGMRPPFFSIFLEDKELSVLVPYFLLYIYIYIYIYHTHTTINPHEKDCFQISGGLYYHKSTLVHRKATVLVGLPDVALCNLRKRAPRIQEEKYLRDRPMEARLDWNYPTIWLLLNGYLLLTESWLNGISKVFCSEKTCFWDQTEYYSFT